MFSFGYELPKLENKSAFVKAVLGGWQLNGIFQGQTGFPLLVTDPVLDIYGMTNRPNMTCDPNEGAPHEVTQWFNTSCFQRRPVAATAAGPGSEPRNEVRGPGFNRTDLSVFKNFTLGGSRLIQVRIECLQRVQPDEVRTARWHARVADLRCDHERGQREDHPARNQVRLLGRLAGGDRRPAASSIV